MLYSVQSGSMKPSIYPGDLIIIHASSDYNVGDVITFNNGQENGKTIAITHRIVEKNGDSYTTKGDFNSVPDITKVRVESIIGKYLFRIPLLGYPVSFAKTVPGFVLLIVIPLTIVIYEEIRKISDEIKKKREKNSTEVPDQASVL